MPRAVERTAADIANDTQHGWIRLPDPVADTGWYQIIATSSVGAYINFDCKGRAAAYVQNRTFKLWWSPVEPPEDRWWEPW